MEQGCHRDKNVVLVRVELLLLVAAARNLVEVLKEVLYYALGDFPGQINLGLSKLLVHFLEFYHFFIVSDKKLNGKGVGVDEANQALSNGFKK